MAIAVRQSKTYLSASAGSTVSVTPDTSVKQGSSLVIIGAGVYVSGSGVTPRLSSVSGGGSWGNVTNVRDPGSYSPNVFFAIAPNVSSGTPTVTASFSNPSSNTLSLALLEISEASASSFDKVATGTASSGTSVSTAGTGTLSQAENLVLLCAGGWFGTPSNPGGWASILSQRNGENGYLGCQISSRVINTTSSQIGTVNAESLTAASALIVAIKQGAIATFRYKFTLNSGQLTNADTGITGYVWRNKTPDQGSAEKYTGLSGAGVPGTLYVTGIPGEAQTGDSVLGQFANSSKTSGLVIGSVEQV